MSSIGICAASLLGVALLVVVLGLLAGPPDSPGGPDDQPTPEDDDDHTHGHSHDHA